MICSVRYQRVGRLTHTFFGVGCRRSLLMRLTLLEVESSLLRVSPSICLLYFDDSTETGFIVGVDFNSERSCGCDPLGAQVHRGVHLSTLR